MSRNDGVFILCYVHGTNLPRAGANEHHIVPQAAGGTDDPSNLVWLCATCHNVLHRCEEHLQAGRAGVVRDIISSAYTGARSRSRMERLVQEAAKAFAAADEAGVAGDGILEIPRALFDLLKMAARETKDPQTGRRASVQGYVLRLIQGHLRKLGYETRTKPSKTSHLTPVSGAGTLESGEPFPRNPRTPQYPPQEMTTMSENNTASIIDTMENNTAPAVLDEFADELDTPAPAPKPAAVVTTMAPQTPSTLTVAATGTAHVSLAQTVVGPTSIAPVRSLPVLRPVAPVSVAEAVAEQAAAFQRLKSPKCGQCLWLHHDDQGGKPCAELHTVKDSGQVEAITEKSEPCDDFFQNSPWRQHVFRMLETGSTEDLAWAKKTINILSKRVAKAEAPVLEENDIIRFTIVEPSGEVVKYEGSVIHVRTGGSRIKVHAKPLNVGGDVMATVFPIPIDLPTIEVVQRYAEIKARGAMKPKVTKATTSPEAIQRALDNDAKMQMRVVMAIARLEDRDENTGIEIDEIHAALGIEPGAEHYELRMERCARAIDTLRKVRIVLRIPKKGGYLLSESFGVHASERIPKFPKEHKLTKWGKLMASAQRAADEREGRKNGSSKKSNRSSE